ncbi:MAG: amidohydrolase [Actinobacteria bacterium]|nr:amidohydrolase [Actinomycetota bacterium]
MKYFDVHCHYNIIHYRGRGLNVPVGYKPTEFFEKELIKVCKSLDMVVAVNGLGRCNRSLDIIEMNDEVEKFAKVNEEYIVPVAYVDLDYDTPSIIDRFFKKGFKGVKIIWTKKPYDDIAYNEFYKRCEYFNMPLLFHTGIEGAAIGNWKEGATSFNMDPYFLEAIAIKFPDLNIIGAHLGYANYSVACALATAIKIGHSKSCENNDYEESGNLFFDISGSDISLREIPAGGYIKRDIPISQLVWGMDEPLIRYEEIIDIWKKYFININLSKEEQDRVFYKNACKIFNIKV